MAKQALTNIEKKKTKETNHTKQSTTKSTKQDTVSVCDMMKKNTSSTIRKMESQIPLYVQSYSDLYTEYLHMLDDLFGTCYIAEKQFFDKLALDDETLKVFDDYFTSFSDNYTRQIEMSTDFMRCYVKMRISGIQSFDKYMHNMMDSYAKMFSQFNAVLEK